jgi:diketogulonate reductase-like aldo/keto reductase
MLIDEVYQTEKETGESIKLSGIPREKIWVTSKREPCDLGRGAKREVFMLTCSIIFQ